MSIHTINRGDEKPSMAIIYGVADLSNTPVDELPSLYSSIDTDALNRVLEGAQGETSVDFSYFGYDISITPDKVVLREEVRTEDETVQVSC